MKNFTKSFVANKTKILRGVNMQKYEVGDRVYMNEQLYKIIHIYDDGSLKLKSVRGKINEIVFKVPTNLVNKQIK